MPRTCRPHPLDEQLYAQVKAAARQRFDAYPSIYANAWLVREYKRRGGAYASSCAPDVQTKQGLRRWFDEQWVDLSRPLGPGQWAPCGRPDARRGAYPKCVPLRRALRLTPGQIKSAVRRKRQAERGRTGKTPVYVSTRG